VIGVTSQGAIRFDVLNVPWRTVATVLAVLYPIISLGLWMGVSWGIVLWAAAALGEVLMHTVWKPIFGPGNLVIALHALAGFLYVVFRIILYFERRRARAKVTLDLL
jgi:hypothetical protein